MAARSHRADRPRPLQRLLQRADAAALHRHPGALGGRLPHAGGRSERRRRCGARAGDTPDGQRLRHRLVAPHAGRPRLRAGAAVALGRLRLAAGGADLHERGGAAGHSAAAPLPPARCSHRPLHRHAAGPHAADRLGRAVARAAGAHARASRRGGARAHHRQARAHAGRARCEDREGQGRRPRAGRRRQLDEAAQPRMGPTLDGRTAKRRPRRAHRP